MKSTREVSFRVPTHYRFSPYPPDRYVTWVEGLRVGPGVDRRLTQSLAVWNLYWLSSPELERHTDLSSRPEPLFDSIDPLAGPVVKSCNAIVDGARICDLITQLSPEGFVSEIGRRRIGSLPMVQVFGRTAWLSLIEARAALMPDGVVVGWARKGSVLH